MSKKRENFSLVDFRAGVPHKTTPLAPLYQLQERFAHNLQAVLSRSLRHPTLVSLRGQRQTDLGTWQNEANRMYAICAVRNEKPKAELIFELSAAFIGQFLNLSTGGQPKHAQEVPLPLSAINEKIARRLCDHLSQELERAWEPLTKLKLSFSRCEADRRYFANFSPSETLAIYSFECQIDKQALPFNVLVPMSFAQQFKDRWHYLGNNGQGTQQNGWLKSLATHVKKTHVTLAVRLGEAELTVDELLNLKLGDVIVLDQKASDPLKLFVEGLHKFNGQAGVTAGHRAFKILSKAS